MQINRMVFVDEIGDRREIQIYSDNMAITYYNYKETGRFQLTNDEVDTIMNASTEDEAFAVLEA